MYTSGSTGKPKGVKIKHESFVASVAGMKAYLEGTGVLRAGVEVKHQADGFLRGI